MRHLCLVDAIRNALGKARQYGETTWLASVVEVMSLSPPPA